MNRNITNAIRFLMDECVPPIIRDSKWFMYPFYYFWFKGKDIKFYMNFKALAYKMNNTEFEKVYREVDVRANDRPADLNDQSIEYMLNNIEDEKIKLADIGCGRGYWLQEVQKKKKNIELYGCDVFEQLDLPGITYVKGNIEKLPFKDKAFDIITCHHTIEHIQNLGPAINELKRIAKKKIMIATPCQRYYYYTLDLHLNFFPAQIHLPEVMRMRKNECKKILGDWVYIGHLDT